MFTGTQKDLGLTDSSCSCSSHAGSHSGESEASPAIVQSSRTTSTFHVAGMTCSHCVSSVTSEVGQVAGAERIDVDLVPGGLSVVTVSGSNPVDHAAVVAAIDEAGYEWVAETP
ncbi:Putative heavy metal binding protein (plasmid) [Cryobacterium arcticum]|uniref:Putative heavy metal binding protein n=1 Tax=Cryobacterium arcticum TaxID=670052 RepID=A0A1B1BQ09_9MICO|nr:Putative heavy metal binding protein [Cryobacterium arcticum]